MIPHYPKAMNRLAEAESLLRRAGEFRSIALFFGNAPAQVHLHKLRLPFAAELPKRRPGMAHQRLALLFHVTKSGGKEHANRTVTLE
jgi:hypothetical protein